MALPRGRGGKGKSGAAGVAAAGGTAIALNTARVGFFRGLASKASLILSSGILAQLPSLFSSTDESEKDFTNELNRASITKPETAPLSITAPDSDVNISAATLAFTKFVNDQADSAETIKPISEKLPELLPSKKYSPLFSAIIENINGIKERLYIVEEKAEQQNAILSNLKTASMSLNTVVKEEMEDDRQFARETKRRIKEEKLERPGIAGLKKAGQFVYDNTFRKAGDYVSGIKDLVISFIKQFALPVGLLSIGSLIELANAASEGETTPEGATSITEVSQLGAAVLGAGLASSTLKSPRGSAATSNIARTLTRRGRLNPQQLRRITQRAQAMRDMAKSLKNSESKFIKAGLKISGYTKVFVAFTVFSQIYDICINLEKGNLADEEFESKVKAQLEILVNDLGGPLLVSYIGGLVLGKSGVALGAFIGPKGAAVGGFAGLLIGGFIGFEYGDEAVKRIGAGRFVAALYGYLVDDESALNQLWKEITAMGIYSKEELQEKGYTPNITPSQMIIESALLGTAAGRTTLITDGSANYTGRIKARHVDERGLFTALSNIGSPQDYYEIKNEVEKNLDPDTTFEDFIAKAMSNENTVSLVQLMNTQLKLNPNVSDNERNNFLNDISTNSEIFKAAFPEKYELVQQGQAVPVIREDGTQTVLTVDEVAILDDITTKSELTDTLERQQRNYLRYQQRQVRSNQLILPPSVSDEMFSDRTLVSGKGGPMVSVIPLTVPMMIPQGTGRGSINHSLPQPAKPSPTISTTDPFIDMRYVT